MRYPRLLFASCTLFFCLIIDTSLAVVRDYKSASSTTDAVPAAPRPLEATVIGEPVPQVDPPTLRFIRKPDAAMPVAPEVAPTPVRSPIDPLAIQELPEPRSTKRGLVLVSYEDASRMCASDGKRLPSVMQVARWAAHNGALVASVEDAKRLRRDSLANAIYLQRGAQTSTVDFYFDKDRFVYPARRYVNNAAIWTSDERPLGGPARANHYAFSMFSASFSPVPSTSALAVVCVDKA